MRRLVPILALFTLLIGACSSDKGVTIPSQYWGDVEIALQTRPPTPRVGMNEFLVIASEKGNLPVHDLIVSIRMNDRQPWRQAIQDGFTGVYRRAAAVADPATDRLAVRLEKGGKEKGVFYFPLNPKQPTD